MPVQLNHHIVRSRDSLASASFLAEVLGLAPPGQVGRFRTVAVDNGVSFDFADSDGDIAVQHYAFLVSEEEFDQIFARIQERGLEYWAYPGRDRPGEINHRYGGRGVYFPDPDGHSLEILTRAG